MTHVVAVTGASGFVGGAVARELERRDVDVRRLVRTTRAPFEVAVDLEAPNSEEALVRALDGVDVVIHAAAHVHRPVETKAERTRFHTVNVVGTSRLARAVERAGVRRVVYVSTIAVHDFSAPGPRDEADAPFPTTAYGATKLLGERVFDARRFDTRIARLATVFGRGDRANFARLACGVRRRRFVIPGDGSALKSVLSIDDAAALLAEVALRESVAHRVLHLADPEPLSIADAAKTFADAFGMPSPPSVPRFALAAAARLGDALDHLGLEAPIDSTTLAKISRDSVVRTDRLRAIFPDWSFRSLASVAKEAYGPEELECG